MPGLGFQAWKAPLVESGLSMQTVRARRVYPIFEGDWLALWTGLRTKSARKLGEAIAAEVWEIEMHGSIVILRRRTKLKTYCTHGRPADRAAATRFAKRDGFPSLAVMLEWFDRVHRLPFDGQLIRWRELIPRAEWRKPWPTPS